jgi:Stage II sporulation protein E (SpoIIE)
MSHTISRSHVRLNKSLVKDPPTGRLVTLVFLVLDTERACACIASAGHSQPLYLSRQSGIVELRTEQGFPLGLMDSEYSEVELRLQPGDRVLIYTDGILEATDTKGEEFGALRLEEALQKRMCQHSRYWRTSSSSHTVAHLPMMPPPLCCNIESSDQTTLGPHRSHRRNPHMIRVPLLELRVLDFRLFQDGDVGVSIFPRCKEILVCRFR